MISKRKLSESNEDNTAGNKKTKVATENTENAAASLSTTKQYCKYGKECYRKNPEHLLEFNHSDRCASIHQAASFVYNFDSHYSLTTVNGIDKYKWNSNALTLTEILNNPKHELVESVQFNYLFDIDWLMKQYANNKDKPLLIVHGSEGPNEKQLKSETTRYPSIKLCKAPLDIPYGTHHTKMMFLLYQNGLKIVIHTSNLIVQDWHQKTQGIWISDLFPKCNYSTSNTYDSKTKFKQYLISYLEYYRNPLTNQWMQTIKNHDTTSANVFLIGSCPGRFMANKNNFGHMRLKTILSQYCSIEDEAAKETKLVCQFSSIGSLGTNETSWLCGEFYSSLNSIKGSKSNVIEAKKPICIYPTIENVRTSLEGYMAGASLPYSRSNAVKQRYLEEHFYAWKADRTGRTRAMPHIKTYAKYSKNYDKLFWFLLTSANLSKAAWGVFEKNNTQFMIRSYEMGVLFLPSIEEKPHYEVGKDFVVPYDLPPTKYKKDDRPWVVDVSYLDKPDTHDRYWNIN